MLYYYNNKLLTSNDGKLAYSQACCCVSEGACCFWSCDYVAEIVWPDIEDPEDIPDISEQMIAAGWVYIDNQGWRKTIEGVENCDDPEVAGAISQELQDEVDGIVAALGGFSIINIDPMQSGFACSDVKTQQECENGIFYPNKTCADNPCISPSPSPIICDQYCYQADESGPQCGSSPEDDCECPPIERIGVECLYRTPSNGEGCPDGDLPDNFQKEPLEGCWNSDDPEWCLCSVIATDEQDCFQNYEYEPWLNPREDCGESSEPGVPAPPNENGGCGGLITNTQIGNCVPVENPLP